MATPNNYSRKFYGYKQSHFHRAPLSLRRGMAGCEMHLKIAVATQFKNRIVDDPLGIMRSWNSTIHFCQWYGVSYGQRHQRVRVLALRSLKLSGTISPHIGNLSFLKELYLQNNSFFDEIPPQVARLPVCVACKYCLCKLIPSLVKSLLAYLIALTLFQ